MKKLLSLILCIVFVCLALVSCKQDVIGEYLPNYKDDKRDSDTIETLHFYIITGDATSEDAKVTVPQNINTYLKEKYKVQLKIHYYTESEYQSAVYAAMQSKDEATRPDIVLINSAEMMDNLKGDLLQISGGEYDFFGTDFKKLNTIVDDALLAASEIDGAYYSVPNNHAIGYYEYIVINKEMARDILHFSNEKITSMTTEESLEELKAAITAYDSSLNVDDYVKVISNNVYDEYDDYEDYEALKRTDISSIGSPQSQVVLAESEINFVNIKSYPVATRDEAFRSAFAIVKHLDDPGTYITEEIKAPYKSHYSKCMTIIYALNSDAQLRNMLQYGYVGTNYTHPTNEKNEIISNRVNLITDPSVRYEMNPIYTGNPFISYFCYEFSWNETTQENWLKQNADARLPVTEQE